MGVIGLWIGLSTGLIIAGARSALGLASTNQKPADHPARRLTLAFDDLLKASPLGLASELPSCQG